MFERVIAPVGASRIGAVGEGQADASRSAEAAQKLFAEAMPHTVIVCDRYSAYKKLARLRGGLVTLVVLGRENSAQVAESRGWT